MIKIEDILFWILILAAVGVAIWLLFGYPSLEVSLVSITLFIASSTIFIWKKIFNIDKNAADGFMRMKGELNLLRQDLTNKYNEIDNRLEKIESLIKRKE